MKYQPKRFVELNGVTVIMTGRMFPVGLFRVPSEMLQLRIPFLSVHVMYCTKYFVPDERLGQHMLTYYPHPPHLVVLPQVLTMEELPPIFFMLSPIKPVVLFKIEALESS